VSGKSISREAGSLPTQLTAAPASRIGSAMSNESLIPYDEIVQEALRTVIGRVLDQIRVGGLPGAHHFYIAFQTAHPGVSIPAWLREKYPDEMTIVIQHRFWDLLITEDRFEIGLSFNQRAEHLVVPFAAVVGFVDPHVNFALQFQIQDQANDDEHLEQQLPKPDGGQEQDGVGEAAPKPAVGDNNVVSLDRFRKK
jgi:uncharacterized protein